MLKTKFTRQQLYAFASIAVSLAVYIIEKWFMRFSNWSETLALVQAIIYTAAVAVVFLLITKSKNVYYGLISAIFAFKVLPPDLVMLERFNSAANVLYFIVSKVSLAIFAYLIYKLYKSSLGTSYEIKLSAVLALLLIVPFFSPIAGTLCSFAYYKTGQMLLSYAIKYALYILAMVILMATALLHNGKSSLIIVDFIVFELVVTLSRKAFSALALTRADMHVSKAYFCWIALYAVLIVCFVLIRKKKSAAA